MGGLPGWQVLRLAKPCKQLACELHLSSTKAAHGAAQAALLCAHAEVRSVRQGEHGGLCTRGHAREGSAG